MAATQSITKPLRAVALERLLRQHLDEISDPIALQKKLEPLAREPAFPGFTWLWGPALYKRDRVRFRSFILSHFSTWQFDPPSTFSARTWDKTIGPKLEVWLAEADAANDVEIFKRLYQWKIQRAYRSNDVVSLQRELLERFRAAPTPAARGLVTAKFDLWFFLDEPTALVLYEIDPRVARPFILKRLPFAWTWTLRQKRELWEKLYSAARARNDDDLALPLYRRQIPLDVWNRDALELANRLSDPMALDTALEKNHPEGFSLDVGATFFQLLEKRGRDVLPYLFRHLRDIQVGIWFRTGYDNLLDLARKNGWWDLWAALIRTCGKPRDFNQTIDDLVGDQNLAETEIRKRLRLLSGVSQELNFPGVGLALLKPLEDEVAIRFYKRFPDILRGPFRLHLTFTWNHAYPKFLDVVLAAGDEILIDYLASRAITRGGRYAKPEMLAPAEKLSDFYQKYHSTQDISGTFSETEPLASRTASPTPPSTILARRAAAVLGQIPAYAIFEYNQLIKTNRLARLLFERSPSTYLDDPVAVQNLLEAPEIHVQALAYRVLGLDDDRARALATGSLDILLGTLLRPLHRATRIAAFRALENAATSREPAERIVRRAREALDLPDRRYPKDDLVGLIGRLLRRWPELRTPAETPRVFGGTAA